MTVKELIEQLKLAKNKDAKVIFKTETTTLDLNLMAEVVETNGEVKFPSLGETTNAVAIKFTQKITKDNPKQLTILGDE